MTEDAKRLEKKKELEKAITYCKENNCKGYKAVKALYLHHIKDPQTINKHPSGNVVTGQEKAYQQIPTAQEEQSLVKYLINRNRACQGLSETKAEGVVLNIFRARQQTNQKGGRKHIHLSVHARNCLKTKHVSVSFFRRPKTRYPQLKRKNRKKVSVNRGLRCTLETAVEYTDDLAALLIENGIAPDLVKVEPGVWEGAVDVLRIWAHDETPQFINFDSSGQSKKLIYAGSGHDCNKVSKENQECVTVQPFSNFAGDVPGHLLKIWDDQSCVPRLQQTRLKIYWSQLMRRGYRLWRLFMQHILN